MPIFVLRDEFSSKFKIYRAAGTVADALHSDASHSQRVFEIVDVDQDGACEFFLKRRLREAESYSECGDGCFLLDPVQVLTIVRDVRCLFTERETSRDAVLQYANEVSNGALIEPTAQDKDLISLIQANREERDFLAMECELLENLIKRRIGTATGIRGLVTWKTAVSRIYSEATFRNADPELYQELLERYYCLDTKAWRQQRPDQYKEIQTTYFSPRTCRSLRLSPVD